MGKERECRVVLDGQESFGKAHCGDLEIDFRGDFRFRWFWKDLTSVSASGGLLIVRKGDQEAVFHLGDQAEKWQHDILNPKSRIDKFGLKPGMSYQAWGEFDDEFAGELTDRAGEPGSGRLDCVFVRLDSSSELGALMEARGNIQPAGMIWAVWRKGRKEFGENHVRDFARDNGLVDVKVAKFNDELSSLKLVIPKDLR
ncbi:MAG: hypothetical protein R2688_06195 [Fimbriimonadaceae bacterium]